MMKVMMLLTQLSIMVAMLGTNVPEQRPVSVSIDVSTGVGY